ncbi:glycosyltransferase family 4 protein [Leucobacter sp. Z1108]
MISLHSSDPAWRTIPIHTVDAFDDQNMRVHEKWADVIVFQGMAMALFTCIRKSKKFIIVDAYDPMPFEALVQGSSLPPSKWNRQVFDTTYIMNEQLSRADLVICASERQRMLYLGMLLALGRITPREYQQDVNLSKLVVVCPFGLESEEPRRNGTPIRDNFPAAGPDDSVFVWSGGLYDWFDPITLIEAVAQARKVVPSIRLFFMGTSHPNPDIPPMKAVEQAQQRASELGLLGTHVIFNPGWVPYDERSKYLLDATAGTSTHFAHIETTFSFRTRILDYLWCRLPLLITRGDDFGELVERECLGIAVTEGSVKELSDALVTLSTDKSFVEECVTNIERVRIQFTWESSLQPVIDTLNTLDLDASAKLPRREAPLLAISLRAILVNLRRFRHRVRSLATFSSSSSRSRKLAP